MAKKGGVTQLQVEVNTDEDLDKFLEKDGLLILDVYTEWCGPCVAMVGNLKKIKLEKGGDDMQLAIVKCDNIKVFERFRNKSEPTWLIASHKKIVNGAFGSNVPTFMALISDELELERKYRNGEATRIFYELDEMVPCELERYNAKKLIEEEIIRVETEAAELKRKNYIIYATDKITSHADFMGVTIMIPSVVSKDLIKRVGEYGDKFALTIKDKRHVQMKLSDLEILHFEIENPIPTFYLDEILFNKESYMVCWKNSDTEEQPIEEILIKLRNFLVVPQSIEETEVFIPPVLKPFEMIVDQEKYDEFLESEWGPEFLSQQNSTNNLSIADILTTTDVQIIPDEVSEPTTAETAVDEPTTADTVADEPTTAESAVDESTPEIAPSESEVLVTVEEDATINNEAVETVDETQPEKSEEDDGNNIDEPTENGNNENQINNEENTNDNNNENSINLPLEAIDENINVTETIVNDVLEEMVAAAETTSSSDLPPQEIVEKVVKPKSNAKYKIKIPAVWTPKNKRAQSALMYLYFRHLTDHFLPPDPEPEPPHIAMCFDAYKRKELMEFFDENKSNILAYGYFTKEDPNSTEFIANSTFKYEKLKRSITDRLVVKVAKRTSHTILALCGHGPVYVSHNTEIGFGECLKFFPEGYKNSSETPGEDDEDSDDENKNGDNGNGGEENNDDNGDVNPDGEQNENEINEEGHQINPADPDTVIETVEVEKQ